MKFQPNGKLAITYNQKGIGGRKILKSGSKNTGDNISPPIYY
jgi:hypothetical protein